MSQLDPSDDLRHRPAAGGRMRDSLFWELIMPDERLGFQAYLYLTGAGKAGFNVIVWGAEAKPIVLDLGHGDVPDAMDFDDFKLNGLRLVQPVPHKRAVLHYESEKVKLKYDFTGLHAPFSYHDNPDGLPAWMAVNRYEQTGRVTGFLELSGRRIEWDRIGHRDHSWGVRDWGVPQHWKWFVAYADDGSRLLNGWIWIAKGEWGFGGYVVRDGELVAIQSIKQQAEFDDAMMQRRLEVEILDVAGGKTQVLLEVFGIVRLPSNDRYGTLIIEGACRALIDGRPGAGQLEMHWSQNYLDHLTGAAKP